MPPRSVGEGLAPPENEKMMEERFKFKRLISIYKNAFLVSCVIFAGGASPSPTGTLCRIRRTAVYHQDSDLHIITPWCVSFHNIRAANISLAVRQISLTLGEYRVFIENISPHRQVPCLPYRFVYKTNIKEPAISRGLFPYPFGLGANILADMSYCFFPNQSINYSA